MNFKDTIKQIILRYQVCKPSLHTTDTKTIVRAFVSIQAVITDMPPNFIGWIIDILDEVPPVCNDGVVVNVTKPFLYT